ncbi:uncharacterized protein C8A04DRAFT_12962 [Dichotomopilus funicola]|uniref:Kinase n=1 Tax=Dichotomopilus funicola TaxID=1934379 RepID=A0AAN6ZLF0_9PEZI|nr:hypothetical protein C8A04DRAFT_12962 [Dichotomopilus funicola]
MSNPPLAPENAAAAGAAAVSPAQIAGTSDSALVAQSQTPPLPKPESRLLLGPAPALNDQGPVSSVPPPLPLPPSSFPQPTPTEQQDTPGTAPLAAQANGTPAVAHAADPVNKHARGPAVLQRPHGPSLLTQALATARGIPKQTLADSSHPHKSHPSTTIISEHSSDPTSDKLDQDPDSREPRNGIHPQTDGGDPLTRRLSPRKTTMPSSTATSTATITTMVAAPIYGGLDLGEVNSMINGHREFLTKNKGNAGPPPETPERERTVRWNDLSNDTFGVDRHHSASARATDVLATSPDGVDDAGGITDGRPPSRPWKTEHRVSIGPEKAWSIGSADSSNGQDGQVEKSISEVLAGVEHNNRSRKASHSLRFFKEGLPEEKGKRKDQRNVQPTREKSPSREETLVGIEEPSVTKVEAVEARPVEEVASIPERRDRAWSHPARTAESGFVQASPEDYFATDHGEPDASDADTQIAVAGEKEGEPVQQAEGESMDKSGQPEPRRISNLSVGAEESTEEGEESGEEKISSAVFLPHQTAGESPEHSPLPGLPQRVVPTRRHSRNSEFQSWLVKADEPEVDGGKQESPEVKLKSDVGPEAAEYSRVAPEVVTRQVEESAPTAQREPAVPSARLSRPVSHYNEDAVVHEPQPTPEPPLDAIELIPYKHQVGGHTTLWRFSRRAVCKQLNNRENEFYEKIEKYHRDLLAFLPRYIGVLNVTFQKQPRRKSTMRKDDAAALERSRTALKDMQKGTGQGEQSQPPSQPPTPGAPRVISQSIKQSSGQIPTVTFVDNQHILPRSLLQPTVSYPSHLVRFRSASASMQGTMRAAENDGHAVDKRLDASRPSLQERHANSWGATTVNKKLRNEVFNDAFLKQPIAIHKHRKGHQRMARRTLQQSLRSSGSDPTLIETTEKRSQSAGPARAPPSLLASSHAHSQSDIGEASGYRRDDRDGEDSPKDVTGTSAPEPEILGDNSPAQKKKRRYSGTGLRRKPKDVQDSRGDLQYFEEAGDVSFKGDRGNGAAAASAGEEPAPMEVFPASPHNGPVRGYDEPAEEDQAPPVGPLEFNKIPRPVNPKEAQTQRDSRVEYFLLLEDLTAGMKRPCIMDLKMGTRQYGVDANAKKQKSQQGKCAKTTSRDLGVRVCGLQVWDVGTQSYEFKDKYYGRELKKGAEFQSALTRFLYDGVDPASILRHIPTVLQKLDELEVIIGRLNGYRFYAASLLMFYDGDVSVDGPNGNHHNNNANNNTNYYSYVEDSTTDFATDTEVEPPARRGRKNPREIDFKMADFANCVTAGDLSARDRPCPPRHPDEPDRGFLRGLRSLRKYFLRIQADTRAELGLACLSRNGKGVNGGDRYEVDEEDEGFVSL